MGRVESASCGCTLPLTPVSPCLDTLFLSVKPALIFLISDYCIFQSILLNRSPVLERAVDHLIWSALNQNHSHYSRIVRQLLKILHALQKTLKGSRSVSKISLS
ncbi:hypothetical protein L6452_12371 [Arctium lappa]|uniref:Uncharacterized protein n=1 Tax=Arctium lappa TaxID=4217 RepID=A0ACB9DR90_ARCLA|nr:hypothetical protein L6452_12371 [Arctium lappa]